MTCTDMLKVKTITSSGRSRINLKLKSTSSSELRKRKLRLDKVSGIKVTSRHSFSRGTTLKWCKWMRPGSRPSVKSRIWSSSVG